ncbi:MAG TPA: ribonuclease H-like YkuK family protein [Symbiobacteriaceae bacterium]|nr:ribonuclease H-like YkuK family protein [Symbiobacteriaceae bacterium]
MILQDQVFQSPTKGALSYDRLVVDLLDYVAEDPHSKYKLIVGTDSHTRTELCFVTAIIIHRLGKGARYYYRRRNQPRIRSLRQKIFYETAISLSLAERLAESLVQSGAKGLNVEIHLDVGEHGETKDLIRDVVGMVVGSGFRAEIKPNSYGASKVADRYTK